jgi:ribosome-associated toxin RatA of RatAB toxin-antitoxin module
MIQVDRSALVGYTAQQMFSLVDRVEEYPEFLPWCAGASVSQRGEKITLATIHLNYRYLKQSFTTENTKHPPHLIEMRLISGPFRHLEGSWRFIELGEAGCKIEFHVHYEFSSKLLEKLLGPAFRRIADSFVDGFIKRAEKIYG